MTLQPSQHGPFRGVDATSGVFYQPKGTVPRASNLIGIARGSQSTCDGSSILVWQSGAIQSGADKFLALDVFEPSGVQPYYLALLRVSIHLGSPFSLAITDQGAGGSLIPNHQYSWVVTALDGTGGETLSSGAVFFTQGASSHIVKLTWSGMPNAFAYNVYRSDVTAGGGFKLLTSGSLPVPQSSGAVPMQFNFIDNGTATAQNPSINLSSSTVVSGSPTNITQFVTSSANGYVVGQNLVIVGVSPSYFNGLYTITQIINSTTFLAQGIGVTLPSSGTGSGGTSSTTVPSSDTTKQTALIEIPASSTPPITWNTTSNIVALFPAAIRTLSTPAVAGNVTNTPTVNVPILSSPNGLVPITTAITFIETFGTGFFRVFTTFPTTLQSGDTVTISGTSGFNGTFPVTNINSGSGYFEVTAPGSPPFESTGTVTYPLVNLSTSTSFFPSVGSTQQISFCTNASYNGGCIVRSGSGTSFVVYSASFLGLPASGGGTFGAVGVPVGAPPTGPAFSTVNGGIVGLVSPIPQMAQFTNRMILALGNGVAPNYYPDSTGTPINPAVVVPITNIVLNNGGATLFGMYISVTTAVAHGLTAGGNVVISGVTPSGFNGVAVVEQITGATTYNAWLFVANSIITYSSGGVSTQSAQPLPNNYTVAYPQWLANTAVAKGTVWVPAHQPSNANVFITCIAAGSTGSGEPAWFNPSAANQVFPAGNIVDGTAVWQETGYLVTPTVPGAAHLAVFSEALWLWNTAPINTSTGIDGPTSIRQSNPGDPFSWNPSNQTFLDKDDGTEGMGLGAFTIAAVGIPPQGSLFAFKNYSTYQITGLFGAGIQIQRVKTERGCTSPRTILFVPGFGVGRLTHLGISIVDGVDDKLVSDPVRPYLIFVNDSTVSDITPADPTWLPLASACLTANPPMYNTFIPVGFGGSSGGALSRSLSFDLVQKCWWLIDLPFTISTTAQVLLIGSTPVTLFGGFQDGLIQRWQFGDQLWLTGGPSPSQVAWSYRTPVTASKNPDQRVFCQEIFLKGVSQSLGKISCSPVVDGVMQPSLVVVTPIAVGDFQLVFPVQSTGNRFYATFRGTDGIEIDGDDFHIVPKKVGGQLVLA